MSHKLVLEFVIRATQSFVQAKAMQEVMSLMLVSGKGAIWFGPGGYGKSEFIRAILRAVSSMSHMVINGNPEMDIATLFGGYDLDRLEQKGNRKMWFNVQDSWIKRDFAVIEEGLDILASVIAAMKNTMTAGQLENGAQVEEMLTKYMMVLTNKDPQLVLESLPERERDSFEAFLSRLPLRLNVCWDSNEAADYMQLFSAVEDGDSALITREELSDLRESVKQVHVPQEVLEVLVKIFTAANNHTGRPISPRVAKDAKHLVASAAVINGRDFAIIEDLVAIKYLAGMETVAADIESIIEEMTSIARSERLLTDGVRVLSALSALHNLNNDDHEMQLAIMALLQQLEDELDGIHADVQLKAVKTSLISQIQTLTANFSPDEILGANVSLPEQLLGADWTVEVVYSEETLAQQLAQQERKQNELRFVANRIPA